MKAKSKKYVSELTPAELAAIKQTHSYQELTRLLAETPGVNQNRFKGETAQEFYSRVHLRWTQPIVILRDEDDLMDCALTGGAIALMKARQEKVHSHDKDWIDQLTGRKRPWQNI